ncbi:MAG: tetratricopeptide repeat protein [Zoogloeaceae bacterium]|nr:tetratricopeptide repeat protein [Zoogloeaceae bacterium]
MTRLSGNVMKVFVALFTILMLASAAPAMACALVYPEDFLPEMHRGSVRKFADETAQKLGAQDTPAARLKLAEALYAASERPGPGDCGRPPAGKQIAFYDEIERRFGDDKSPKIRAIVLKALIAKTDRARSYDKYLPEGNDVNGLIKRRYATDNDPEIQALYVEALVSWTEWEHGYFSPSLPDKKRKRAIFLYDEIFARYRDSKNPGVRAALAKALFNKASLIRNMKKRLSRYDEIIQRFGKDDIPEVREEVTNALLEKGNVLRGLGRYDEAVAHYDNSMRRPGLENAWVKSRRYASKYVVVNGPLLAMILVEKGKALEEQGKLKQAVATYDQAIAAYDAAEAQNWTEKNWTENESILKRNEMILREEKILDLACYVLSIKAAVLRKLKGKQAANAVYEDIVKRIEKSKNKTGRAGDKYFFWYVYGRMCEVNYYTYDTRDACTYVLQRISRDNPYIQKSIRRAIKKRKARQKP